jgi:hypothetical protein
MRPGQNKRLRGRNNNGGRKGPNPLTRSFESNGPDVKIRGTAQHVAEKYLQLARDAQTSGDIVMAENLLQHAEHYFRLIAAAQQQTTNAYGRQSFESENEVEDDDDDFTGVPDRFAPLAERLPPAQPAFQPQPAYSPPQPQAQPHFAQPQPFEERPFSEQPRHERQNRPERPPFRGRPDRNHERGGLDRGQDRGHDNNVERGGETGERGPRVGFDRNRERNRFPPRVEVASTGEQPAAAEIARPTGLPAFITAPPAIAVSARPAPLEVETPATAQNQAPNQEQDAAGFNLASRRRRRPRPPGDESRESENGSPLPGELPLGD